MALDLAFESTGSGPSLVILHGLFGSGGNWRGIARGLAGITASIHSLGAFPAELRSRRFDGPLHVIGGGRSDYVEQRDGTDYRPMFARPQLDFIEEAGHWVHADAPQRFLALAARALGSVPQGMSSSAEAAA